MGAYLLFKWIVTGESHVLMDENSISQNDLLKEPEFVVRR